MAKMLAVAVLCLGMVAQINAFSPWLLMGMNDNFGSNSGMGMLGMACVFNPNSCGNNPAMFLYPALAQNDNLRRMMLFTQMSKGARPNLLALSGNDNLAALGAMQMMQSSNPRRNRNQHQQPAQQQSNVQQGDQQQSGGSNPEGPSPTQ